MYKLTTVIEFLNTMLNFITGIWNSGTELAIRGVGGLGGGDGGGTDYSGLTSTQSNSRVFSDFT